jgi:hypothetical protein
MSTACGDLPDFLKALYVQKLATLDALKKSLLNQGSSGEL